MIHHFAPNADLLRGRKGTSYKIGALSGIVMLTGYASGRGQVRFVIALRSNNSTMRFLLLRANEAGLWSELACRFNVPQALPRSSAMSALGQSRKRPLRNHGSAGQRSIRARRHYRLRLTASGWAALRLGALARPVEP